MIYKRNLLVSKNRLPKKNYINLQKRKIRKYKILKLQLLIFEFVSKREKECKNLDKRKLVCNRFRAIYKN